MTRRPESLIDEGSLGRTAELARRAPLGCFVEVGVYKGGSAWFLAEVARERGNALHLFDTFTGIPFEGPNDGNRAGEFADTSADAVRAAIPDAVVHVGIFPATLPADLHGVAFVHCDCDQFDSVRSVIDELWPRMVPGGIMVFDDVNTRGGQAAINATFPERQEHAGRHYVVKP